MLSNEITLAQDLKMRLYFTFKLLANDSANDDAAELSITKNYRASSQSDTAPHSIRLLSACASRCLSSFMGTKWNRQSGALQVNPPNV